MSESHTDTKAVSGSIDSSKIIDLTDLYVSESKAEQAHQHNLLAAKKSDASKSVRRESPVKVVIEGKLRTIPQERSSSAIFRDMRIISGAALTFSAKNPDDSVHVGHRRLTKVPATSKSLMQMVHDSITTDSKHHSYDSGSVDHMNAASIASCNLQASSIPPEIRLNVKRNNTNLDKFRQKFPVPSIALPSTTLPEWRVMSLENKIPYIPAPEGTMVFSRGALGQSIAVKQKEFTLADPKNYESKVAPIYNSLHDPHAASYLKKPVVQKVLMKNGLINKRRQVVCSLKEFNIYRTYLRSSYNKTLQESLKDDDSKSRYELNLKKRLNHHYSETNKDGNVYVRNQKRKFAVATIQAKRCNFLHRIETKQERERHVYHCHIENKIRQRINLAIVSLTKTENNRFRLRQLANARNLRTQQIKAYIAAKEKAAEQRLLAERNSIVNAYKIFVTEWLLAKFQNQEQRLHRDRIVRKCLVDDLDNKSLKRLVRLEKHRATLAYLTELRQKQERRLWGIVKKYFYRWLNRVRFLRELRPDEQHRSMWDITDSLRKTIEFLVDQTGHSQFKALVFNLKQLKAATEIKSEDTEDEGEYEHAENASVYSGSSRHKIPDSVVDIQQEFSTTSTKKEETARSKPAIFTAPSIQFNTQATLIPRRSQYKSRKQLNRYLSRAGGGSTGTMKTKLQPLSKPSTKQAAEKKSVDFPDLKKNSEESPEETTVTPSTQQEHEDDEEGD